MTEKIVTYGDGEDRADVVRALEHSLKKTNRLDTFRYLFHITRNYPWTSPQKHFDYIRGLV